MAQGRIEDYSEVGKQICSRNGVKAILTGTIAQIRQPVPDYADRPECGNGGNIAQEQLQAARKKKS
jgi:hypothetical protein